ncbi:hypothetical protein MMC19_005701 [Ptychographa xylographoides]|nr:hypothetical protein [Ptychographa xylographoides]
MQETDPAQWLSCLQIARSIMIAVDRKSSLRNQPDAGLSVEVIEVLQTAAYQDPDGGGEVDIALWCERQWATEMQRSPDSYTALQGLGNAWLLKSQKTLARIQREESSSSSDTNSSPESRIRIRRRDQDCQDLARISSPDYVEARGTLRPALDLFDRAIQVADVQESTSGGLLSLTAQAYISFANVSHPQTNEQYYQKALQVLRRAGQIQGYQIEPHLQQFLDDNLQFID